MKLRVIPFEAGHLHRIDEQEGQAYLNDWVSLEDAKALESQRAFTGLIGERVLICAGVSDIWPGRAIAWAYIDRSAGPHFVQIHRAAQRFFGLCDIARIECTVDVEFAPGHRWARMLGFQQEAPVMRSYRPGGGDSSLYARVR